MDIHSVKTFETKMLLCQNSPVFTRSNDLQRVDASMMAVVLRVSFLRSEWDQVRHNVVTAVRTESEVS